MKIKNSILFLLIFTLGQSVISQSTLPKIENYTKGEIELRIISFGEKNAIRVGKITKDGTIHFEWPELDLSTTNDDGYFTTSIKNLTGAKYCNDPNMALINEEVKLVETKFVYLYKYDQVVGCIVPSTQKGQEHREKQLGSTINWIYSYDETSAKATCSKKMEWEDLYSFDATTTYDLNFNKGWNIVSKSLTEIEDWTKGEESGRLPKTNLIQSVKQIPTDIHWHLKYWANDKLIELERNLIESKPLTKTDFVEWLPKELGTFKRSGYEYGKVLERLPDTNNVNVLFEKGSEKIELIIVDCAGNKDGASMYTLMQDMASRDWRDETKTGYQMASKIDDYRVMTEYNESEKNTTLNYNAQDRFLIKVTASNMKPEELWKYLTLLNIKELKQ